MTTTLLTRWKKALGFTVTGLLLVGAMLVTTPKAQAVTVAELQGQINLLLAQLAAIQGNTSTSCFEFSRDLTVGSTGPDVSALQNYLKTTDHFPFAVGTTGYFGDVTRGAVAAWQSSNGLVPPAGYFGPLSRARYALLCQPIVVTPPVDDSDDDNGDDDDDSNAISADNAIDDAEMAIDDAREEIDEADDDGEDVDEANDLLDDAEAKLDDARDAFDDDDFEEAEDLANDASDLADDAVDAIDEDDNDGDTSVESTSAVSPVGNNEARADYEIKFTLKAFGGSFYLPRSTDRDDDPSDGSVGIEYFIEGGSNDVYEDGDTSASFSASGSNAGDTSSYFKVNEGQSRQFTLRVSLDNNGGTEGYYGLQVGAVRFDDDKSAGGEQTISTGLSHHETDVVFVSNENN